MVEFGEQLRRAREGKGMTQQSLAEVLLHPFAILYVVRMIRYGRV